MPRGADVVLLLWALAWTAAVVIVQQKAIAAGGPSMELLFLGTHGGAELLVLYLISSSVATDVDEHGSAIELERDHAGVSARWTRGTHSSGSLVVHALMAGAVHLVLILGALASALTATSPVWAWPLAAVAVAVWSWSARHSARQLARARREGGEVMLTADLDGIRVREPTRELHAGWDGLSVEAFEGVLRLETPDALFRLPCLDTPARAELVDALKAMAARPRPKAKSKRVPAALERLRGAERDLK